MKLLEGRNRWGRGVVLGLGLVFAGTARAHDFWIEPSTFRPAVGSALKIGLRVGDDFRGEAARPDSKLIERFASLDATGETPVVQVLGPSVAGLMRVERGGPLILAYQCKPSKVVLPAERFEAYLRKEGLESILAVRRERSQAGKASDEVYARYAKSLLMPVESAEVSQAEVDRQETRALAGPPSATSTVQYDRRVGLLLELVPARNPYEMHPGDELPLRLFFKDRPLEGVQVRAIQREKPEEAVTGRTDSQGCVKMGLSRSGCWLVECVHMSAAPAGSGADWQSYWASLTFEVPAAP